MRQLQTWFTGLPPKKYTKVVTPEEIDKALDELTSRNTFDILYRKHCIFCYLRVTLLLDLIYLKRYIWS